MGFPANMCNEQTAKTGTLSSRIFRLLLEQPF
jgi:hypothetical protein